MSDRVLFVSFRFILLNISLAYTGLVGTPTKSQDKYLINRQGQSIANVIGGGVTVSFGIIVSRSVSRPISTVGAVGIVWTRKELRTEAIDAAAHVHDAALIFVLVGAASIIPGSALVFVAGAASLYI